MGMFLLPEIETFLFMSLKPIEARLSFPISDLEIIPTPKSFKLGLVPDLEPAVEDELTQTIAFDDQLRISMITFVKCI